MLGFILPPLLPDHCLVKNGSTDSSTSQSTVGATEWISGTSLRAEDDGASAVWATDHLFWSAPTLECIATVTLAAGATRRAAVGTCVLQLPLRAAAAVAKQSSTLQLLSGGRFVLGVGVGSHEREHDLAGAPFADRGRRLDAGIAAVRRAWSASTPGYRLAPALPAPIWIGGSSRTALRRAAAVGDGWIPLFVEASSMADAVGELQAATAAGGREPGAVMPAVVLPVSVGSDAGRAADRGTAWLAALYGIPPKAFARHLVAGPAERCADAVSRYLGAGVAHVAVLVAGDDASDQFATLSGCVLDRHAPAALAGVGA